MNMRNVTATQFLNIGQKKPKTYPPELLHRTLPLPTTARFLLSFSSN